MDKCHLLQWFRYFERMRRSISGVYTFEKRNGVWEWDAYY
jgi:hypothetical protein